LKEKVAALDDLMKRIQNLKDNEDEKEDEDEDEVPYQRYFLKENIMNKDLDTYVKSLGVPTLNFLERWRDVNIPDNSK